MSVPPMTPNCMAWKVMFEKERVKWTKVDIKGVEMKMASLFDQKQRLTETLKLTLNRVALAKDFLHTAQHTPIDFRLLGIVSSTPDFQQIMQGVIAYESFMYDARKFIASARDLINQARARDPVNQSSGAADLKVEDVAQGSDSHATLLLDSDYQKRLEELSEEHMQLKDYFTSQSLRLNLKAGEVEAIITEIETAVSMREHLKMEIEKIKEMRFFERIQYLLIFGLKSFTWTLFMTDKDGNAVPETNIKISVANIVGNLLAHFPVVIRQIQHLQETRYIEHRKMCIEIFEDPKFRGEKADLLCRALQLSYAEYFDLIPLSVGSRRRRGGEEAMVSAGDDRTAEDSGSAGT